MNPKTLATVVLLIFATHLLAACSPTPQTSASDAATIAAAKATDAAAEATKAAAVQTITQATATVRSGQSVAAATNTSASSTTSTPLRTTATPTRLGGTLTPSSTPLGGTPTSSPTPAPAMFLLTKRDGTNIQLSSISWGLIGQFNSAQFSSPTGVPTASGVEVSFDYITRVEFGIQSNTSWPVTITLLDGNVLKDDLGFKARLGLNVSGKTDLGTFETNLTNVQTIALQRATAPKAVPDVPPSTQSLAVIENRGGTRTKVSGLTFRTRCVLGWTCCYGDSISGIPLVSGINVDPARIKLIEVGEVAEGKTVPVTLTTIGGKVTTSEIRTSGECTNMVWRLQGSAALGSFEIQLDTVRKIESASSPSQPSVLSTPSASGQSGTLIPKKGTGFEFTSLRVARSDSLPLKSGLKVSLDKVKDAAFGEESSGSVPVTITALDGRTVTDTIDSGALLEGDTALGTFTFKAKDVKQVTFLR